MVKNLVRLALASEYSRRPIKREDITKKALGSNASRQQYKAVFQQANEHLQTIFGMNLTEMPARERITVTQKRAAQRAAGNKASANENAQSQAAASSSSSASKQYILTSTLPSRYRVPGILPPAPIPTPSAEAGYIGLTTFVLSLIYLSPGGTISESRLEKHLKRMNADQFVLGAKTDKDVLTRMQREGYIIKVKERDTGGEETIDYVAGPRAKVEIAEGGVAGLVRKVYRGRDVDMDELERRLARNLGEGVSRKPDADAKEEEDENGEGDGEANGTVNGEDANGREEPSERPRRRSGRRRRVEEEQDEEEGEEEEEGEDEEEVDEEEQDDADDDDDDDDE